MVGIPFFCKIEAEVEIETCSGFAAKTRSGPAGRAHHFLSPSLSPVGSSLLRREPPAESISRYLCRVIRVPTAAEPRMNSPPFFKGGCHVVTEGF